MLKFSRRKWLGMGCASCAAMHPLSSLLAQDNPPLPGPHVKPDLSTDEGGLWAALDREETKLRRSSFVIKDPELTKYLSDMACSIGGAHCPNVRVYPVRNPSFNAIVAPNGMMQIYSGMLLRVENEAQMAAIMGHEITHYMMRHTLERLRDAKAKSAFMTLLAGFGLYGAVGMLLVGASALAYSRDQERDADLVGLRLASSAGFDPSEAAKLWSNLRDELTSGHGGDPAANSVFFSTHPNIQDRTQQILEWSKGKTGKVNAASWDEKLEPHLWQLLEDELRRAQYDESLVMLERQILRRPQRSDLVYFKGEAHRLRGKEGDADLAHIQYARALTMNQPSPLIHRAQGHLYKAQGKKAPALTAYQAYLNASANASDAALIQSYITELQS